MEQTLSISDLPLEITTHILENLEPWDFVRCQRVCKGFKEVVDHHLSLQKIWDFCCIDDGGTEVAQSCQWCDYSKTDSGCKAILSIKNGDSDELLLRRVVKIERTFKDKDPSEIGIEHFGVVARNPMVRLNECFLILDAAREELFFKKIFDRMDHKLYTKELTFCDTPFKIIRRVLAHVQPGFLEKISIYDPPDEDEKIAKEITEMDHWKLAKQLSSSGYTTDIWLPIDDLLHADRFEIKVKELTVEDLIRVKEKLFASPNFKEATIVSLEELPIDEFTARLGPPIIEDADSPNWISYKIPGTEEYLHFEFNNMSIDIMRY